MKKPDRCSLNPVIKVTKYRDERSNKKIYALYIERLIMHIGCNINLGGILVKGIREFFIFFLKTFW